MNLPEELSMSPSPGTNLEEEATELELAVIQMDVRQEAHKGIAHPVPVGGACAGPGRNGSFEGTASDL